MIIGEGFLAVQVEYHALVLREPGKNTPEMLLQFFKNGGIMSSTVREDPGDLIVKFPPGLFLVNDLADLEAGGL